MRTFITGAVLAALSVFTGNAGAEEMGALVGDEKAKEVKKKDGWEVLFTPGASLSLTDNRDVVGQPEGMSLTVGAQIKAATKYRSGDHQFRANLDINETFTRTPVLDELIKSTDIFKFEALYLYDLLDWLGPYVRFGLDTNLLEGFAKQPDFVRWRIVALDGSESFRTAREFRLTDGFAPLQLRESAGFFATPYAERWLNVEIRLGFGGLHLLAEDQYALNDDAATEALDVIELDSFNQAGVEGALALTGDFYEKRIVYNIGLEVLVPLVNDLRAGDDRNAGELTNVELNAGLRFKIFEWMSLDYLFRLVRVPQLIDKTQMQNNLLLTLSWSLLYPEPEKEKKEAG